MAIKGLICYSIENFSHFLPFPATFCIPVSNNARQKLPKMAIFIDLKVAKNLMANEHGSSVSRYPKMFKPLLDLLIKDFRKSSNSHSQLIELRDAIISQQQCSYDLTEASEDVYWLVVLAWVLLPCSKHQCRCQSSHDNKKTAKLKPKCRNEGKFRHQQRHEKVICYQLQLRKLQLVADSSESYRHVLQPILYSRSVFIAKEHCRNARNKSQVDLNKGIRRNMYC